MSILERFGSRNTLRQGIVLMVSNSAGGVIQYLFHFYVSRQIGAAEYGVVNSLLAFALILSVPGSIVQTVVTQYVAEFEAHAQAGRISGLVKNVLWYITAASIVVFAAIFLASPTIASALHLPSVLPVIAMGSMFLSTGGTTALLGALQGMQRFYSLGAVGILNPAARLAAAAILIGLGWGATGAIGAATVSSFLIVLLCFYFLRDVLRQPADPQKLSVTAISRYSSMVFTGTMAFTLLTNADAIIVKHYFSPLEAGYYSAASVLGKLILFLPTAVGMLLFPKTTQRRALGQSASDLLRKSVLLTLGMSGAVALVLAIFPAPLIRFLFGVGYEAAIPLAPLYGAAMVLFALVQLMMMFYLAQADSRFVWLLSVVAMALILWLVFFHYSLEQIIASIALSALVILMGSEMWLGGLRVGQSPQRQRNESA